MSSTNRHPSTVADYDDARRRIRLRETRLGAGWRSWRRTRLVLLRSIVVVVAALTVFAQYWQHDVTPERERLARTEPGLLPVAPPYDERRSDTAVVDMVGLGGLNAEPTATALPALRHFGVVWAVRYDNAGIDTLVIAELIVQATQLAGVRDIVLVGHSMGGVIALEVARHLHWGSDRRLVAVLLDCTPVDLNAVRPESRSRGTDLMRLMGWLPGARESRILRLAVEITARRDRFANRDGMIADIDHSALRAVAAEVLRDKIFSRDAASNGLIHAQFLAIVGGGAADDLRALARSHPDKPRPAIVFIRPMDAARDHVVDVDHSHRVLVDLAGGVDGTLLVVRPRLIGHADPRRHPDEYNTVIESQVLHFVQRHQHPPDDQQPSLPDN
ncbi:alpha/beta hydrolase [Nocardia mangyaensis]|uniref:Alpha/beta hydrolase n=1 Tax=Nocardia mangyaensis TaxID=2213200 RepID=A0A1J0VQ09_9NOCA|nr:alpha/beta hydrolase [Nocardia mangyaensis]APE34136.1 alpha/beta hydrolase [Nocardia mangyaensis]